jgi:DNA recombination protein RmuC
LYGIRTPALVPALRERQELFEDAFNRNVMIVSPTTLLISLRTIASIWRYEYQNRNAQELVRQCTALYDKFVGFVADLEDIRQAPEAGQAAPGPSHRARRRERVRHSAVVPSA